MTPDVVKHNRLPWRLLILPKYPLQPLKMGEHRRVVGFDTETLDGYARIITTSNGLAYPVNDIDSALHVLTKHEYRNTLNFFYNIQYDFEAIVKWLGADGLTSLALQQEYDYDGYHISYIPHKTFKITRDKNAYRYYDVYQFYNTSLDDAAQTYLGEGKTLGGLDRGLIGSSRAYWKKHYDEILAYSINDARLTARLGALLQDELHGTFGFHPKSYVSQASLSKQYFRLTCTIPDTTKLPRPVLRYAFEAYHGGRFEVTERGRIGECTALAIRSAYPYQISLLLDVTKGVWKRVCEMHDDAAYGFYLARVRIPYMHLCPLPYNYRETVIYPCGEWTCYLSRDDILTLPAACRYEIINGYEFYPSEIVYPFKQAIERLYEEGLGDVYKGQSYKYQLYKIIMNSLYGCFYEKHLTPDKRLKTGLLFNPVYASIITSATRKVLYEKAMQYGKRTVSLATDGLLVKGAITLEEDTSLGAWSA